MTRNVDDSRLRNRVSVFTKKKQIIIIKEQNFVLLLNVVENIRSNDDETQNKKITTEGCKLALLIFHPTVNQFLFPSIEQCHCQMFSLLLLPLLCIAKMHFFFFQRLKIVRQFALWERIRGCGLPDVPSARESYATHRRTRGL
jgi:hypothetical protein